MLPCAHAAGTPEAFDVERDTLKVRWTAASQHDAASASYEYRLEQAVHTEGTVRGCLVCLWMCCLVCLWMCCGHVLLLMQHQGGLRQPRTGLCRARVGQGRASKRDGFCGAKPLATTTRTTTRTQHAHTHCLTVVGCAHDCAHLPACRQAGGFQGGLPRTQLNHQHHGSHHCPPPVSPVRPAH